MLKKVLSYSVWLYAVSLLASLMRIVVKSYIAKTVGKEALGAYAYYMTVINLGSFVLAFGLRRSITKFVVASSGENESGPVIVAVMSMGIVASLVMIVAGVLLNNLIDWIYVLALVSVGLFTVYEVARSTLRGQFDQKREIIFAVLAVILQAAAVIGLVSVYPVPQAPVWGLAAANVLLGILIILYFAGRFKHFWNPAQLVQGLQSAPFRGLMLLSTPLWITDVLEILGTQFDQLIVQARLGYIPLAEYAAAFTFIGIMDQPITVMSRVFLVSFAGGYYSDIEQYKKVTSVSMVFYSVLGLLVVSLSAPLTPIIFTKEYTLVPLLVAILSISCIFSSVEVLNSSLTIACDFPQANRNSKIWTTAVYIPLALLLVSRFGVIGAACSYVTSWGGYALTHALYMRRKLPAHAAYTFRELILGTSLYAAVIFAMSLLHNPWLSLLIIPFYLGLGQLLQLWDLTFIPEIIRRLLPKQFAFATLVQRDNPLETKEQ